MLANISQELYDEMIEHARQEAPNECCGMIAIDGQDATAVYPAINAAASPLRYEVDPRDQYRIEMAIDDAGWELGAIYHSHTRSAPYPSQTDINLAFHPNVLYIIIGLQGDKPEVRAYRIVDQQVTPINLVVGKTESTA